MAKNKFVFICLIILYINSYAKVPTREYRERLQIISDTYRKSPYIQVPTAWITPKNKIKLLKKCRDVLANDWQVQEIKLEAKNKTYSWAKLLKCHPAVTIRIQNDKKTKLLSLKPLAKTNTYSPTKFLLLVYPRSYRSLIEDPLLTETPPIEYLGSTRRLAFYSYKSDNNDKKESPIKIITAVLKIKI